MYAAPTPVLLSTRKRTRVRNVRPEMPGTPTQAAPVFAAAVAAVAGGAGVSSPHTPGDVARLRALQGTPDRSPNTPRTPRSGVVVQVPRTVQIERSTCACSSDRSTPRGGASMVVYAHTSCWRLRRYRHRREQADSRGGIFPGCGGVVWCASQQSVFVWRYQASTSIVAPVELPLASRAANTTVVVLPSYGQSFGGRAEVAVVAVCSHAQTVRFWPSVTLDDGASAHVPSFIDTPAPIAARIAHLEVLTCSVAH